MWRKEPGEVSKIIRLILSDKEFDWNPQEPGPYNTIIREYQKCCTKREYLMQKMEKVERRDRFRSAIQECEKLRDAYIKIAGQLCESLVPFRSFDKHGSTAILVCFEHAPQEVLQAMLDSLPQRHQSGEFPICVSVDLDGDTGLTIASRRGSEFLKIAEAWRDHDLKPEVLQRFIERKDYRQAAELYYHQRNFENALEYLDKVEECVWSQDDNSSILRLRSHIALARKQPSEFIDLNRAAFAAEFELQRIHEVGMLQKELCEGIWYRILPAEIITMVIEYLSQ
ncbi:MAG: hypothetical protein Q9179_007820 [Wetmoreana sp. 5 TL-2023]